MAIGLKVRDVRRFGQKLQKGVRTFARKLGKTADVVGSIVTPLATTLGGAEAGLAVSGAVEGVKGIGRTAERLTGKGVGKGVELFKQAQQPVLGGQELVKGVQKALKSPEQGQIMIGDVLAKRFGANMQNIQRE